MSVEFDTPANRIIASQAPKNQFKVDTSLSDLTFLRQMAIQGRLRYFQGSTSGAGTSISVVPPIGETLFIYRVIVGAVGALLVSHSVLNDGNIRATVATDPDASTSVEITYFDSLVGDGIKAFTVTHGATSTASAFGWVENTSRIRDVTI